MPDEIIAPDGATTEPVTPNTGAFDVAPEAAPADSVLRNTVIEPPAVVNNDDGSAIVTDTVPPPRTAHRWRTKEQVKAEKEAAKGAKEKSK